jgi:hypothetical protein
MKLLSPTEVKSIKSVETAKVKSESAHVRSENAKALKEFNAFKTDKEKEKRKIIEEFTAFCSDLQVRKLALENEVSSLEERKREALKPIADRTVELDKREEAVRIREATVLDGQLDLETRKELFLNENDDVEDKREQLIEWEGDLAERDKRLTAQEQTSKKLSQAMNQTFDALRAEIEAKRASLEKKEIELTQQAKANAVVQEGFEKQRTELDNYKRQLRDQARTLDRAWKELKINKQMNGNRTEQQPGSLTHP